MAQNETAITITGNLTADPELRFTQAGAAVANFTVASTPRQFDKQTNEWRDLDALFMRCNVWRQQAENVAESLVRGQRVTVVGRLRQRSFETREGEKRTVIEMEADEVNASLLFATVKATRVQRGQGGGGNRDGGSQENWASERGQQRGGRQQQGQRGSGGHTNDNSGGYDDPWGSAPPAAGSGSYDDEPPF